MNRDIEFRGRTVILEWQYGFYTMIGNKHYICTPKGKNGVVQYCIDDENTIGQYTGLKDKNGKKIFEGDIVKSKYGVFKSKVEWNDSFCGFFPFCNNDTGIFADECEVIGNIYENKELLEV